MSDWRPNRSTCAGPASSSWSSSSTGLVPGGQRGVGVGVDVGLGLVVRHWNVGAGVDDSVMRWPPHRGVGGGNHLPQELTRNRATQRGMDVRGEPALWFEDREVLHVVTDRAAQVLDEPVPQLRQVQRIEGGAAGASRCARCAESRLGH